MQTGNKNLIRKVVSLKSLHWALYNLVALILDPQSHVHAQNWEETVTGHHAPSRPAVIVTADIQKQEEASSRIEPESDSCSTAADDTPILHHSEA